MERCDAAHRSDAAALRGHLADRIREVRALYIRAYGEDPEIEIITGPAPQAAKNVAQPTIEALARRWE